MINIGGPQNSRIKFHIKGFNRGFFNILCTFDVRICIEKKNYFLFILPYWKLSVKSLGIFEKSFYESNDQIKMKISLMLC